MAFPLKEVWSVINHKLSQHNKITKPPKHGIDENKNEKLIIPSLYLSSTHRQQQLIYIFFLPI